MEGQAPEQGVRFLCYFVHQRLSFRLPELESVARLFGHSVHYNKDDYNEESPFLEVTLPSETAARQMASRSILIKGFFEIWGKGTTYEELLQNILLYPREKMEPHIGENSSYKYNVDSFGRSYNREEQIAVMGNFKDLPFRGKIKMKDPDNVFWIIEEVGHNLKEDAAKDHQPKQIFFARQIALGNRELIDRFSLKKRGYLGTTSMSSEWSILMTTQGLVLPDTFVYDPFAGTGSLLILSAFFGAKTFGTDIDPRVLKGDTKLSGQMGVEGACVHKNFEQYGLSHGLVDLVACDMSNPPLRLIPSLFDAIICDPPYGVRAGAKKVGKKEKSIEKAKRLKTTPTEGEGHIPQYVIYDVPEVLRDLLDFGAKYIRLGGRLVYWLPTTDKFQEEDLPRHPCFVVLAASEHAMTIRLRRRLITMEKTVEFNHELHGNLPPSAYGRLEAHAHVGDYFFKRKDFASTKKEK